MKKIRRGAAGILDVAKLAGVSAATVSRFFNSPELVRAPTKKRIADATQELGYIRNRNAGSLHTRFSGTFGLIVPTIDNAIFAEMIAAFSRQLQAEERTLLIAAHGYDLGLEISIVRSLLERRIDGIALIGHDHDSVAMNMLALREVPVVSVWNVRADSVYPCVGVDNYQAGRMICEYLINLGHRDIALLFPDTHRNDRARDRLNGVRDVLAEHGCDERLLYCPYDIATAKSVVRRLMQTQPPSAIISGNDVIAQGAIYAVQSLNLQVPQNVSVAGIGDFRGSEQMEPALTTVRLPAKRIGMRAADALLALSREEDILSNQALALELLPRASTAPYRG